MQYSVGMLIPAVTAAGWWHELHQPHQGFLKSFNFIMFHKIRYKLGGWQYKTDLLFILRAAKCLILNKEIKLIK